MKTQIIHLDPNDDVSSVKDKITWSKARRLILVWPGRGRVLTSKLDLKLIQRFAARREAEVGVVSMDPDVLSHASALSIPVFENLNNLPESAWIQRSRKPAPLKRKPSAVDLREQRPGIRTAGRNVPRFIRVGIFSLTLFALLVTAVLMMPSARIIVDPIQPVSERTFILPVNDAPGALGSDQNASILREDRVLVQGTIRIPTSGKSSEPAEFARGQALFTNQTDDVVVVPAQSTIREPGDSQTYFVTRSTLSIPDGPGSQRSVEIIASIPGLNGNVPPGTITAVDGDLGLLVSVTNPEPTTGGSVISRNAVAAQDLATAREQLTAQLLDQAGQIISANQLPQERLIAESLTVAEVVEEQFDRQPGVTADTLGLDLNILANAYILNTEILGNRIQELALSQTDNEAQLVPDSLEIRSIQLVGSTLGEEQLSATVAYQTYRSISYVEVFTLIKGLNPINALKRLEEKFPLADFRVQVSPEWFPVLPFFVHQMSLYYPWDSSS